MNCGYAVYACHLLFQLISHVAIYNEESKATQTPSIPLQTNIHLKSLRSSLSPRLTSPIQAPGIIRSTASYAETLTVATEHTEDPETTPGETQTHGTHGEGLRRRRTQDSETDDLGTTIRAHSVSPDPETGSNLSPPETHGNPQLSLPVVLVLLPIVIGVRVISFLQTGMVG